MPHYPEERKAAVLSKLLPPHNRPVPEIAKTEGISEATLYNWLKQVRQQGVPVPGSLSNSPEDWNGEAKFAVVIETAPLNATELSEYCRAKGLYPEQIARWRQASIEGATTQESRDQRVAGQLKAAKQHIRALEKDLRRKEKALAESAALLVLQKKFNTLWEDEER
jgi:transposase